MASQRKATGSERPTAQDPWTHRSTRWHDRCNHSGRSQWYLLNTGQDGGMAGVDINVLPAWSTATGQGITIIDGGTGIECTNLDIAPNPSAATSLSLHSPLS